MLPKKPKEFIKPTAEKLNVNEDLVSDLVNFYWKEVRKTLSDLKAPRVTVAKFGYFQLKFWMLPDEKKNYEKYLESLNPNKMTFMKHTLKEDVVQRLNSINKVMAIVEQDKLKKKTVKEKRYAKETKENLEKSQGDIPGNKE